MDLIQERIDILTQALEHREREVMHHQINIDNYERAIAEIEAGHPDMGEFADRLRELLASSRVEQAKERIMLKVIRDQLEEAACTSS